MKSAQYRHTKIVFTIGPSTAKEDILLTLLEKGVDICRLNMAHATHDWTKETISLVKSTCEKAGRQIALMMDIKGPEIRTGFLDKPIEIKRDDTIDLFLDPNAKPVKKGVVGVSVNYPGLAESLKPGDTVLVDSGLMRFRVEEINKKRIRCSVRIGGSLGSRRHINLPGIKVNLPALTKKDKEDIQVGINEAVDFFALSFVREPDDLDIMRRHIKQLGSKARIIAKIEDQSAITNLDDIIKASDGLMVARGDLGIEIPFESLPLVQRRAVKTCQAMGKPAIVATHLLESMIENPLPTRAEVTDISNAVFEQADAVMLSGETTTGKYPVECVETMNKIIRTVEANSERTINSALELKTPKSRMLKSAVIFADSLDNSCIVVFTRSGYLARTLSALRPTKSPIFAFTDEDEIFKNLLIYWGVEPFLMNFSDNHEKTVMDAFDRLKNRGWIAPGKKAVVVTNVIAGDKVIDTIQFRIVD